MSDDTGTIAHPRSIEVPVNNGERKVTVRKWKMRDRAALRPRIAAVFDKLVNADGELTVDLSLGPIFIAAEEEICGIAEDSTDLPDGLKWDDIDWEDMPNIVQAVWALNIFTPDGGGLVGKAVGLLTPMMSSLQNTESGPSGQDSVISEDGGVALQSVSSSN